MVFDKYLNMFETKAHSTPGKGFKGIFGLGEKVGPDFFLPDGIYSLWSRDDASPVEDGKSPGKNIYGTHPFYMFKNDDITWVGVYTKLVAA